MPSLIQHWYRQLRAQLPARLPRLLPSCCALCGSIDGGALCAACEHQFFDRKQRRCGQCATVLPGAADNSGRCGECLHRPPAYDATIVAADYAPPADQLVLALKFGNQLALAPLFARLLRQAMEPLRLPLPPLLAPVPLGTQRLAERGFNQALEIARPLARALGCRLDGRLLLRQRETAPQSLLPPAGRHGNVRHAFLVAPHAIGRVCGQHIGVVDDVMTTGETLNELAATLKRFGAARVTNLVFARTLHHGT